MEHSGRFTSFDEFLLWHYYFFSEPVFLFFYPRPKTNIASHHESNDMIFLLWLSSRFESYKTNNNKLAIC